MSVHDNGQFLVLIQCQICKCQTWKYCRHVTERVWKLWCINGWALASSSIWWNEENGVADQWVMAHAKWSISTMTRTKKIGWTVSASCHETCEKQCKMPWEIWEAVQEETCTKHCSVAVAGRNYHGYVYNEDAAQLMKHPCTVVYVCYFQVDFCGSFVLLLFLILMLIIILIIAKYFKLRTYCACWKLGLLIMVLNSVVKETNVNCSFLFLD